MKITSVWQSNCHLHRQCGQNQKPSLCADLICLGRHVTSRNQGTFSREEEIGPWKRGWQESTTVVYYAIIIIIIKIKKKIIIAIFNIAKLIVCILFTTTSVLGSYLFGGYSPRQRHGRCIGC